MLARGSRPYRAYDYTRARARELARVVALKRQAQSAPKRTRGPRRAASLPIARHRALGATCACASMGVTRSCDREREGRGGVAVFVLAPAAPCSRDCARPAPPRGPSLSSPKKLRSAGCPEREAACTWQFCWRGEGGGGASIGTRRHGCPSRESQQEQPGLLWRSREMAKSNRTREQDTLAARGRVAIAQAWILSSREVWQVRIELTTLGL